MSAMRNLSVFLGVIGVLLQAPARAAQTPEPRVQAAAPAPTPRTVDIPFTSHDGHEMFGKLTRPEEGQQHPVVVYVQTAEGMTVDMTRPKGRGESFNYFDLYRDKLRALGWAFFSYEGRGIRVGDAPPRYERIDWDVYNTSTLDNKVRDVLSAVRAVQKQSGIDRSRIWLMGASEGTLLAAEAASRAPDEIGGLILYGAMSGTMREHFKFIVSRGAFMTYRGFFDTDKDGRISKAEFEADPRRYRQAVFKNAAFELFDRDGSGFFTAEETEAMAKPLLDAVDTDNYTLLDQWAKNAAGVSTPAGWFRDHFSHAPIWTFLAKLNMPIGVFHGDMDTAAPIEGVQKLEAQAKQAGKTNLRFHYFPDLDHSLNIGSYFQKGTLPAGHEAIFAFIGSQTTKQ